jgi:hypothetical protein
MIVNQEGIMNARINDTAARNADPLQDDEHRLRSERIAAQGVRLGRKGSSLKYVLPLVGLAVLASMALAQS